MIDPHLTPSGDAGPHPGEDAYPAPVAAFVERFAADLTEAGMPRMPSRVFACLLVSRDGALSSADLAERLRISPAAVSGAVRYLSQVRMVSREREPGSRRERYRLLPDVWYEAIASRDTNLLRWVGTLKEGARTAGEDGPAGQRLAETAEFLQFLVDELRGVLERWRVRQAERGGA